MPFPKLLASLRAEGIKEDMFGGAALGLAAAIHAAATLGGTDIDPVGSAIAGAGERGDVYQGFQQQGVEVIKGEPVLRKPAGGAS